MRRTARGPNRRLPNDGSADCYSYLISVTGLCNRLDSRFRGNDGGAGQSDGATIVTLNFSVNLTMDAVREAIFAISTMREICESPCLASAGVGLGTTKQPNSGAPDPD